MTIDDLKQFRQLHSKTPGHPEYGYAPGIETTTGPLGQGITNGVGMALAEKVLAAQFNKPGHEIVDHNTYVFLGDGCLMEGISHEACSLAGALGLGKLIAFYDDNNISIDGEVRGHGDTPAWFLDDTPKRFDAYNWHVIPKVDGHDAEAIKAAIEEARTVSDKPTLICCQTIIGFGSPNKQGKEECHGAPLGDDEIALTREALGWTHRAVRDPGRRAPGLGCQRARCRGREGLERQVCRLQGRVPGRGSRVRAPHGRRAAGRLRHQGLGVRQGSRRQGRDHRHPQGFAERAERLRSDAARVPRRLRRPGWLQPDLVEGLQGRQPEATPPATTCTTACASSACPR